MLESNKCYEGNKRAGGVGMMGMDVSLLGVRSGHNFKLSDQGKPHCKGNI